MLFATCATLFLYIYETVLQYATMLKSIRRKLLFSHIASLAALLLLVALVVIDLRFLQAQIFQAKPVNDIQATAKKLTLLEENFLLVRQKSALPPLLVSVKKLKKLLSNYQISLKDILHKDEAAKLHQYLNQYETLISDNTFSDEKNLLALTKELRAINGDINRLIESMAARHHNTLEETANLVFGTLSVGVVLIVIITLLSAVLVTRFIVNPLRNLEQQLEAVADKRISKLTTISNDTELLSFVSQFNSMLDKLKAQEKLLRNKEKTTAVGILVSGVAHELNNPLSNISTSAQLLLEEDETRPDLRHEWLTHIDSEIERARRIVRRLLDSVYQQNQPLTNIYSAKLVGDAVTLIHRQLDPEIILDIEDISETLLSVNYERFKQVFINLIKNSVDAGATSIKISGETVNRDDSRINTLICSKEKVDGPKNVDALYLFTITDDGKGIPEEDIPNLFTPFFSTKKSGEGTGLGLYIVNEIITEHDGCITVKNRDEGGCEFRLLLPIVKET